MRSLKLAFRTLFKSPFVTGVAILSLALGIGANAAIFSLFNQILLQPLPVHEPNRLVNLSAPGPKPGSQSCNQGGDCETVFSYAMFRDLEAAATPLAGLAAHRLFSANVAYDGQTANREGKLVSGSYFPLLGVRPALGRLLGPGDDETIGAHPVAVLGHGYWEDRLGGASDVVGRTIVVNGQPLEIVGVAPKGFNGTTLGGRPAVYVPITMRAAMNRGFGGFDDRRAYWAYVFGRLAPGATLAQADAALNAVYRPIIQDVEAPLQAGMSEQALARFLEKRVLVEPGRRGQSAVHDDARIPLLLLLGTAGIVLLIACANIANLLLARGAGRSMEMAIRLSLGASRRQVLAQLLTESLVLAALGGLAGLVVAQWTLRFIGSAMPPEVSEFLHLQLNMTAVGFAAVAAVATGLLFGMFPALHSTRSDLVTTIRSNAGNLTVSRGAARFRNSLVTAQIALSMALLITAGLFLRSIVNIGSVDLGMTTERVVTFGVSPQLNGYDNERSRVFFARLEEELGALAGVTGVTASLVPLLAGSSWGNDVSVQGFERRPDVDANARLNRIGPGYFATLDVPLLAGREFTDADHENAARVAIVNEAFARKFNLGSEAVGRLMGEGAELNMEIVGLIRDAKYSDVKDDVPPVYFTPYRQNASVGTLFFYVRAGMDPAPILRAIPGVVAGLDPNLPVQELKTLPQQVRENVFLDRMIGTLSAAFAVLATLLAAIGLYGVLAYTVAQRTREFGIRMALGADAGRVRGIVLRHVGIMLLIGGVLGLAGALALGRGAASLLYGIEAGDPLVMVGAVLILSALSLLAGLVPARRAAGIPPVTALRYD